MYSRNNTQVCWLINTPGQNDVQRQKVLPIYTALQFLILISTNSSPNITPPILSLTRPLIQQYVLGRVLGAQWSVVISTYPYFYGGVGKGALCVEIGFYADISQESRFNNEIDFTQTFSRNLFYIPFCEKIVIYEILGNY